MLFVAAIIAAAVLGGALTAMVLTNRWRSIVDETRRELESMTATYREHEAENQQLKQKVADLQYEANSLKKDLNYERSRRQED
ncbi:hypothetical protein [Thalassolituus sp.]|jgi:uncharacterized protein YlxW (UPF0749 family)|uniref:hypothetical protein n=1 Tax=Thalassolituus sp. TaxID=2030822 RepID=UPI00262BD3AF|nr:hypothetical protein [uncultured Thalassolituus sp.]TNC93051.1 MAG: hypothetical protein CSH36_01440 [Thalassolituus sp.]